MRLERWCLLLTAAMSLQGSGCVRWGYDPFKKPPAANGDGGVFDAAAAYAGGSGGAGGTSGAGASGGRAGKPASASAGGAPAAGSGGGAGASAMAGSAADAGRALDAGTVGVPMEAGVEAGVRDAAAADGGLITYAGCPSRPGVLFCDDFEVDDPGPEHWSFDTSSNGTVTRTQARARSGQWSLLAATTQDTGSSFGSQARKATLALNQQTSGHIWFRSYNLVPNSVSVNKQLALMILSNTSDPYHGVEPRLIPGDFDLNTSGAGVVPSLMMPTPFPRDQWVCVELHVFVDPVNGFYECYFDRVLVAKSGKANTLPSGGYTAAEVGIHYAPPAQAAAQVFVDDVYLGTSRIPCD